MAAQGAELVEHGRDFQAALEFARELASRRGYAMIESFHERLVWGTATFALELFQGAPELDVIYVPIGMGSSACGVAAARNALKLRTEIVGVTSAECPAYALSFKERRLIEAPARTLISDGQACRTPNLQALEVIWNNVARIVEVTDDEIAEAMSAYYQDTHNVAEGAGAASLAAALKEKSALAGKRAGIVLTGGNVDRETFVGVLTGAFQPASQG
jgi:threonine dehydratase